MDTPWDKLDLPEKENPMHVVGDFFDYMNLPQARSMFWELLKTTVTGSFNHALSGKERLNMFYFLERLEKLMEAAYLLRQRRAGKH